MRGGMYECVGSWCGALSVGLPTCVFTREQIFDSEAGKEGGDATLAQIVLLGTAVD